MTQNNTINWYYTISFLYLIINLAMMEGYQNAPGGGAMGYLLYMPVLFLVFGVSLIVFGIRSARNISPEKKKEFVIVTIGNVLITSFFSLSFLFL